MITTGGAGECAGFTTRAGLPSCSEEIVVPCAVARGALSFERIVSAMADVNNDNAPNDIKMRLLIASLSN